MSIQYYIMWVHSITVPLRGIWSVSWFIIAWLYIIWHKALNFLMSSSEQMAVDGMTRPQSMGSVESRERNMRICFPSGCSCSPLPTTQTFRCLPWPLVLASSRWPLLYILFSVPLIKLFGNIWLSMASLVIFMQLRYLFHEVQRRIRRHKNYLRVVGNMEARWVSRLMPPMLTHLRSLIITDPGLYPRFFQLLMESWKVQARESDCLDVKPT